MPLILNHVSTFLSISLQDYSRLSRPYSQDRGIQTSWGHDSHYLGFPHGWHVASLDMRVQPVEVSPSPSVLAVASWSSLLSPHAAFPTGSASP